jgi:NADH-quinone oxidoreductase subunit D
VAETRFMTINMGPQHPATHGVLRMVLELDGEIIKKSVPFIGYLHRGVEKLAEARTYHQALTLTDRLDYTNGLSNNLAYCLACERLMGLEIPRRAQYLRVILCELQRLAAHLLWLATHALDIGAMTVLFYAFRERETILTIVENVTGARLTPSYIRIGGLAKDVPPEFNEMVRAFIKEFPGRIDEYETLLTENIIWRKRTQNVALLSAEDAVS